MGKLSSPGPQERRAPRWELVLLVGVTTAVVGGGVLWLVGRRGVADVLWAAATLAAIVPAILLVVRSLVRRQVGVDVIAVLALAGALAVREYLAGAVVAVMLATGRTLEGYAERRAARDLHALLEHAPRSARRRTAEGGLEVVSLDVIQPEDRLLVSPGEVVAVDGSLEEPATLDESVVTGESQVVAHQPGDRIASGVVNAGAAFGMRAATTAQQSTYAGIVRLAEEATRRRAPMVRLADRYAAWFVPFTLALAGLSWLISGSLIRAVAVLVVATPCPLILATPIAIVAGLSRAARDGVVVRDGGGLEALGRARTLLVDKTGTLTLGRPTASETVTAPGVDRGEALRLAASLEQLSQHVLAAAVVREAQSQGVALSTPTDVTEEPGSGVTGRVDGRKVSVGQLAGQPPPWAEQVRRRAELDGASIVWVSLDDSPAAALVMQDPVRTDARRTVRRLREAGFNRLIMLTGDRPRVAAEVARVVGADDTVARCGPDQKAERVRDESGRAVTVMIGDGVNDAPALAEAHVGVAIGGTGATASAEVADAVLTVDRLDRLADVVEIARHSRRIALQNATGGMGLALVAMGFAAAGFLPPVAGAFLQEGIDVLVILNALRALGGGMRRQQVPAPAQALVEQFAGEHRALHDALAQLHTTADHIATDPDAPQRVTELRDTHTRLTQQVLTHEDAEEHRLYPALAAPVGAEATGTMSRGHVEIHRLVDRIGGHLDQVTDSRLHTDQIPDLLATLYGLDAVLRLHSSQEEEEFFSLTAASNPVKAPGS